MTYIILWVKSQDSRVGKPVSLDPWNDYVYSPGWRVLQVRTVKCVIGNLTWGLAQGLSLYPG